MRVALQVIAFNVDPWINAMLANAAPYVDKIFLAYPPRPWGYSDEIRRNTENPTSLEMIALENLDCEVEVVRGDWMYDEDTRNCLLQKARLEGFDWMVIQDADEFYTHTSWLRLLQEMRCNLCNDLLITPWFNFWKSPEYVIENRGSGIKCLNEGFAVRLKDAETRFIFSRRTNAKQSKVIDEPCYHYGYVMSDSSMLRKINTWAHSNEVFSIKLWYELKWRRWDENSCFLHPGSPSYWLKATRFPLEQPEFALPFFSIASKNECKKGLLWALVDGLWNCKAILEWRILQLKRMLRNSAQNLRNNIYA